MRELKGGVAVQGVLTNDKDHGRFPNAARIRGAGLVLSSWCCSRAFCSPSGQALWASSGLVQSLLLLTTLTEAFHVTCKLDDKTKIFSLVRFTQKATARGSSDNGDTCTIRMCSSEHVCQARNPATGPKPPSWMRHLPPNASLRCADPF